MTHAFYWSNEEEFKLNKDLLQGRIKLQALNEGRRVDVPERESKHK